MNTVLGMDFERGSELTRETGLIQAYVSRRQIQGFRSLKKIPYYLKPLFVWLREESLELTSLTPILAEDYQSYLVTKQSQGLVHYATQTVRDMVVTAEGFFGFLKECGQVRINPFTGHRRIKTSNLLPRYIPNQKEMSGLLEALRTFWSESQVGKKRYRYKVHVMAELLYSTGMRIDELAHLEVRDIDFRGSVVTIREGKGGTERKAYLNEYAKEILRIYVETMREAVNNRKENPNLFGVVDGRTLDSSLNSWLKATCGLTSHTFRHAVGTHLLQKGCDLRFIQMILGHEDLNSTALYTKINKDDLKVELDKFHPRS